MPAFFSGLIENILFVLQRVTWVSVLDLLLVTLVFFSILQFIKDTQAIVLLRGAILLIVLVSLLTSLEVLPAFSWLVRNTLPAMILAIPVIFAPEIRRTLERLGRAGSLIPTGTTLARTPEAIKAVVSSAARLADRRHGALIVFQRQEHLDEYVRTGVALNAHVTPELILQIFYPNTPLHDGAIIISGATVIAAACVLPLSSSGVLTSSPERQMGLRHRAALGISEVTDALAIVISEETGSISIVDSGRMIRKIEPDRLEIILRALLRPLEEKQGFFDIIRSFFGEKKAG